jgi:hypothetical protein
MSTPLQFTADLTRYQAMIPEKANLLVQGFNQTLYNEVQAGGKYSAGTPIVTGFAQASWDAGVGSRPNNQAAKTPEAAAARASSSLLEAKAGDTVYLSNNAPYVRRLEFGFQGPDKLGRVYNQQGVGWIRMALAAVQQIADEVGAFIVAKYGGVGGRPG